MVIGNKISFTPKFFSELPFWVWSMAGLICLALSMPGFLEMQDRTVRQAALTGEVPTLVELRDFDASVDISPASEVNLFVQTNSDLSFSVDAIGGVGDTVVIMPVFSVYAAPGERSVTHVIFAEDRERFGSWLERNTVGTSRMGELREINGAVVEGKGYRAAIRVTLRDAGLDQVDPLIIVQPFLSGRVAALNSPTRATFGNPFVLSGSGLLLIWFGFVVWSRGKAVKQSVGRRMGEIGVRSSEKDSVTLSRLARTSKSPAADPVKQLDFSSSKSVPSQPPAESRLNTSDVSRQRMGSFGLR